MRLRTWRYRLAEWIAGVRIFHPWDLAEFDRIYTDAVGRRHILDGSQGHASPLGFHHGERRACIVCREGRLRETATLPRRFEPRL